MIFRHVEPHRYEYVNPSASVALLIKQNACTPCSKRMSVPTVARVMGYSNFESWSQSFVLSSFGTCCLLAGYRSHHATIRRESRNAFTGQFRSNLRTLFLFASVLLFLFLGPLLRIVTTIIRCRCNCTRLDLLACLTEIVLDECRLGSLMSR